MSRFEPNTEPSMEEILASIRRIIAEDGSGSKSSLPPQTPAHSSSATRSTAGSTTDRPGGFLNRDAFLRSSSSSAETKERYFTPVTPPSDESAEAERSSERKEDGVGAPVSSTASVSTDAEKEPERLQPPSNKTQDAKITNQVISQSAAANAAVAAKADAVAESNRPAEVKSFDASSSAPHVASPVSQPALSPPDRSHIAASIDAQLAELLGDDRKASSSTESTTARAESVTSKPIETTVWPDAPSVSRSSSNPAHSDADAGTARDAADPFAFDLGPSPFARSAEISPAPLSSKEAGGTEAQDSRVTHGTREVLNDHPQKYVDRNPYKLNGATGSAGAVERPAFQPQSHSSPLSFAGQETSTSVPPSQRQLAPFAVPSVSATLGPQRRLEPLSEAFKASPREAQEPVSGTAIARANYARSQDDERAEPGHGPRRDTKLSSAPGTQIPSERTMEDAMADLLRPLLKTWLAENMPKIVERALRREMNERLLPGRDNAND